MQLIHTADWQFGKTSIPHSLERQESALMELCEVAIKNKIDEILVVGDIFQKHIPTQEEKDTLLSILFEFERSKINVRFVPGNHDWETTRRYHSLITLEILKKLHGFKYIHVYSDSGVNVISNKYALIIVDDKYKQVSKSEVFEQLPVVLAHHGIVNGAILENGIKLTSGVEMKSLVRISPIIDYIALGDIHQRQKVYDSPLSYYCGGLLQHTFGETSAGFLIVELGNEKVKVAPYDIKGVPRLQMLNINIGELKEGLSNVLPGLITKIVLQGVPQEKTGLDLNSIRQKLIDSGSVDILFDFKLQVNNENVRRSKQISSSSTLSEDFVSYMDLNPLPSNVNRDRLMSLFSQVLEEVTHDRI